MNFYSRVSATNNVKSTCFLVLTLLSMLSKAAVAASCTSTTLDQYMVSGFSCSVGNLELSNFSFYSNSFSNSQRHLPSVIQVTPQSSPGLDGLAFTNLGVYFNGYYSNTTSAINFTATALNGAITGDSLIMTNYSTSGSTFMVQTDLYTASNGLDPSVSCSNCASPPSMTSSQAFAGITSTSTSVGVSAINNGFGSGSATVNGVTALFATTATPVPLPAAIWMFASGVLGLLGFARRKAA